MAKTVKAASAMDDETLVKHLNARHVPIADLKEVKASKPGEPLLRAYHERIHWNGYDDLVPNRRDVNHTHEPE